MSKERPTYVTYNEGVDAKHLHLGNLVHDYKSPKSFDPYIEKAYTDIAESSPSWAKSTLLENYALTLGTNLTKTADTGKNTPDSVEGTKGEQRHQVAAAAKTTKLEIKDPKKFFNDITLVSDEAKKWLTSHLSAGEGLAPSLGKSHPRPQIWMLTGLILMTHATWTSLSSKEHTFTAGLQAPFDPTGVSAIRRLSVSDGVRPTFGYTASDDVKHVSGAVIHETGKYPGTRCWAAQWQLVDTQILSADKRKDGLNNQLKLKNTAETSAKIALVDIREGVYAESKSQKDEDGNVFDDDYWEAFLDAAEQDI